MNTFAITTVTYGRKAIFFRTQNAELMVQTLLGYRERGRFLLHGFAVMPDHLHVLLTPGAGQTVERCVQCIKGGFSFLVRKQFKGEVWQASFHAHRVRDGEDFVNQVAYIANNPERCRLIDYLYVHTKHSESLDSLPRTE